LAYLFNSSVCGGVLFVLYCMYVGGWVRSQQEKATDIMQSSPDTMSATKTAHERDRDRERDGQLMRFSWQANAKC